MKKGTRIFKQYLATFLIVLMSIESFAAVVGDNDGAAFITKAEFDSMKNDFQSQLDRYNSSIDNKIDGAIASYLAGVSIAKTIRKSTLCYDETGILSVREGQADIPWTEGLLHLDLTLYQGFNKAGGCDIGKVILKSKDPIAFKEASLVNLDRVNGYGIWNGYCTSKYKVHGVCEDWNTNYWQGDADTSVLLTFYDGFYTVSNKLLSEVTDHRGWMMQFALNKLDADGGNYVANSWANSNIQRTIEKREFKNLILAPTSAYYGRFVDYDEYRDFLNDAVLDQHTVMDDTADWVDSITNVFTILPVNAPFTMYNFQRVKNPGWSGTFKRRTSTLPYVLPFFGFIAAVNKWEQVATSKYDNLLPLIKSVRSDISRYKDKDNVEHLLISAGAPIVEINPGDIIKIDLSFKDQSANYDVWFKLNGWNKGEALEVDDTVLKRTAITKDFTGSVSCDNGSYGSKSIKVTRGKGTVYVKVEDKGYLFMKWSLSGNNGAGGGTFLPPQTVEVTSS